MSTQAINRAPAAAQVSANVTTAQIFPNSFNSSIACLLTGPGGGVLEQKRFWVRASGYVTTGTNTNVTITLYSGTSLTAGGNTVLGASTARAVNTTSAPWNFEAVLTFDSVSGKLQGSFKDMINNILDADAALSNVVTGVSGAAGSASPALNFVIGVTFSAANVGNIGNLGDFSLDA
jgi:hypothetical protein